MVAIFAALAALTYGSSDFCGGLATRKSAVTAVVSWSQVFGLLVVLIASPLLGTVSLTARDILWGIGAGLSGAAGVGFLYNGLASGLASVVSPVASLTGAALPVIFAVLSGERPEMLTWTGVALALPAIFLLSAEKGEKKDHVLRSLQMGFLAGCGFSGFFILIAQTGDNSGMWPLLAARLATVPIFLFITLIRGRSVLLERRSRVQAILAGVLDMSANIFYLLASRTGFMITAVVITAFYPAPTVLLQRIVRKEKLTVPRICGIVIAIIGASLIGVGSH